MIILLNVIINYKQIHQISFSSNLSIVFNINYHLCLKGIFLINNFKKYEHKRFYIQI